MSHPGRRVAVLDGYRTPFTKAGGALASTGLLDLSTIAVRELAERAEVGPDQVGLLVMGSGPFYPHVPYIGRETALALGWDRVDAYEAACACATSARTFVNAAQALRDGECDVAIAGGAESMSNAGVELGPRARAAIHAAAKAGPAKAMQPLLQLTLGDLLPPGPAVSEPYSGLSLGRHAEEAMRDWGVTRTEADAFAVESHLKAAAATADGRLPAEIVPVVTRDFGVVDADGLIRGDTSMERAAKLPAVFDPEHGTVTAANASPLTDGASAVLLATEEAAERMGKTPKAWLRSYAFTSHSPDFSIHADGRRNAGVLLGPAFALPLALERAGIALGDLDLLDVHEAFAGQVLANLRALESQEFAVRHLGRDTAVGKVDPSTLNVNGGSISIGHPFGATGTRLITQLANEMQRRDARYGALAICAGGTRGAAIVLERDVA